MPHDRKSVAQRAWQDLDTYTLPLVTMFLDKYGTEALEWDPTTIALEIEQDFDVALPKLVHDRLMTGIVLMTTDLFYKSTPDFIAFCNVLAGTPINPELWDPADALEIAWGITEAMLIEPPGEDEPFIDETRAYIGKVLDAEGIMNAPDILRIALRDPSLSANVQGDFSDDPEMFSAVYGFESGKTDDINNIVRRELAVLLRQMDQLQLDTGDVAELLQSLSRGLDSPSPMSVLDF